MVPNTRKVRIIALVLGFAWLLTGEYRLEAAAFVVLTIADWR